MKVYLSGSIKANPNYIETFDWHELALRKQGHTVVNPVAIDHHPNASYADYMRKDIQGLLECDAIAMIPGWEVSQGAKLEFLVATMCDMTVIYL